MLSRRVALADVPDLELFPGLFPGHPATTFRGGSEFSLQMAALGLSAIVAASPVAYEVIRWLGAAYLLWIAVQLWKQGELPPRPGDLLVTNRRQAILTLVADSSPGVHDTLIASCDIHRYHQLGFAGLHDNCTDNLRMAMLAVGLRAAEIPCPFNIWMNTPPLSDGSIAYRSPVSVPGDHVELRAELDCIAVVSACPMDLLPINGADNAPKALHAIVTGEP